MRRAYLIEVEPDRWTAAYRLANTMLRAGHAVAWTTEPLSVGARTFPRGTFALAAEAAGAPHPEAAARGGVTLLGPVDVAAPLLPLGVPRVSIYGGGGAPYNYARILAALGFFVEFVQPEDVLAGGLEDADVFMMPGGGLLAMKGQIDPLGEEGAGMLDRWVRSGGMYIGSCAGAFDAAIVSESFARACPAQRCMRLINARVWNSLDTEWIGLASPGVGVLHARVTDPGHPVMFHLPPAFEIVHYNGPLFEPVVGMVDGASETAGLAAVDGVDGRFTPSEYFLRISEYRYRPGPETLIGRGIAAGVRTVTAGSLERGRVVLFGSHPEFGTNLIMDRLSLPAMMLANAVLWQSSSRPRRQPRASESVPDRAAHVADARTSVERITSLAGDLQSASIVPAPPWLREDRAMSTFGLPAAEIWTETLREFPRLTGDLDAQLRRFDAAARGGDPAASAAVRAAAATLAYRVPEFRRRDFGFEGLEQTLERCERMLRRALSGWSFFPQPSANPYADFESSPYHQAVGSYLAASGVLANACALVSALADQLEVQIEAAAVRAVSPGLTQGR